MQPMNFTMPFCEPHQFTYDAIGKCQHATHYFIPLSAILPLAIKIQLLESGIGSFHKLLGFLIFGTLSHEQGFFSFNSLPNFWRFKPHH
jgi:hypothetical protein